MKIFTDTAQMLKYMSRYIINNKQKWIYISSYGIWVYMDKFTDHNFESYRFMRTINETARRGCKVDIIIGYDCKNHSSLSIDKLKTEFKHILMHKQGGVHAKYILCSDGTLCIGSSNINDSRNKERNIVIHIDGDDLLKLKIMHELER